MRMQVCESELVFQASPAKAKSSKCEQDCEEVLAAKPWERKCAKRRMDALHALGFSAAAYQVRRPAFEGTVLKRVTGVATVAPGVCVSVV